MADANKCCCWPWQCCRCPGRGGRGCNCGRYGNLSTARGHVATNMPVPIAASALHAPRSGYCARRQGGVHVDVLERDRLRGPADTVPHVAGAPSPWINRDQVWVVPQVQVHQRRRRTPQAGRDGSKIVCFKIKQKQAVQISESSSPNLSDPVVQAVERLQLRQPRQAAGRDGGDCIFLEKYLNHRYRDSGRDFYKASIRTIHFVVIHRTAGSRNVNCSCWICTVTDARGWQQAGSKR